ncbi:hypothetical protein [Spirosoma radiotolerans]|uniref:Lipocalin-like domain-containing protein n=1 Tax=Spirosoma radiotolerans TaxID=1379870 RepID=A0A0E3ZSU3_9BACT|nr:hypothetical protein [Spirosoma radiotolerans]AKD53693.1 hypothetical protein SD10_01035 [Spirosoma radiotolerans]
MKTLPYILTLLICLINGCRPSISTRVALDVAGTYQLILFSSSTTTDDNPSGTVQATEFDGNHINLVVKGQSGKVNINYAYSNVVVTETTASHSGQIDYTLTFKKQLIGSAHFDGVSRSIVVTPSSKLRLEGLEL